MHLLNTQLIYIGVDFLHSVTGEFDDKVTQSEIQELEGTLQQAQNQGENTSLLQDLLNKVPEGVFGGKDEAGKADELKTNAASHQMANAQVSPREPEEWLQYVNEVQQQIYPIIEWHDEVMQGITETIENIPILPNLIEQIQEQVNVFVFSLLAPFVLPIIAQIKAELNTGSSEIIQSSVEKQHIVFRDDDCSDPTHSMLSKDHFSNVLNEPAGKIAGQVLKWVVPQLIAAWDDDDVDVDRTLNRVIRGVFHHPALRNYGEDGAADGRQLMFSVVEQWWEERSEREKDSLRDQLSRDGVEEGRNHKPGVKDHGHGSAKKLGMPNSFTANHPGAPGGFGAPSGMSPAMANQATEHISQAVGQAVGGGALGSLVGGLAGAVGGGILSGGIGGDNNDTQTYNRTSYGVDDSRTQTATQYGGRPGSGNYGQAQHSRNDDRYGGRGEQHSTYNQASMGGGYPSETRRYEENTTSSYQTSTHQPGGFGSVRRSHDNERTGGYGAEHSYGRRTDDDERPSYGRRHDDDERPSYGRRHDDEDTQRTTYERHNDDAAADDWRSGYGRRHHHDDNERNTYGRRRSNDHEQNDLRGGYGQSQRQEPGYGSSTQYGQQQQSYGASEGYGRDTRDDVYNSGGRYGRQEATSYGRSEGFGRSDRDEYGGGDFGRQHQESYGSGGYGRPGGNEYAPASHHGGRHGDNYGSSGFDESRRRGGEDEIMPGGFSEVDDDNMRSGGYGGRRYGGNDRDGYGGGYGGRQSGGYGY